MFETARHYSFSSAVANRQCINAAASSPLPSMTSGSDPCRESSSENERREKNGRGARRKGARSDWVKFVSRVLCLTAVDLNASTEVATHQSCNQ